MISFPRTQSAASAEHSDAISISGRSVSFNDDIEMEENKSPAVKKDEDSEEDSDGVQFIAIKVTSADGSVHEERTSEAEETKPSSPKRVQMSDSPPKFDDHHDDHHIYMHPKVETPFHEFGKTFFLVCIWLMMIAFLASTPEKKIAKRQLVVGIDEPKFYNLPAQPSNTLVHITIQAPFLPDPTVKERRTNNKTIDKRNKENLLVVFLRTNSEKILTPNKTFYIYKPEEFDYVNASRIEINFDIGEDNFEDLQEDDVIQAVFVTNFSKTLDHEKLEMPITFSVDFMPINKPIGVLFAAFTLILLYALIVWEVSLKNHLIYRFINLNPITQVVHRTFAAIIASTLSIALLAALNDRPTHEEIMSWIDVETILLLFSMMILVGILTETGVFDHLAVYAYRVRWGWGNLRGNFEVSQIFAMPKLLV